jgi:hypothetical protein
MVKAQPKLPVLIWFAVRLLVLMAGAGAVAASPAAAGPPSGAYVIHPAGAPRDCLIMTGAPAAGGAHLLIDVGCARRNLGQFAILRHASGRYTVRLAGGAHYCATVARGVVFGAPSIDFMECGTYDEADLGFPRDPLCQSGERDQVFDFVDGPNYLIYGLAGVGASPFGAWDVGDYGQEREVKYWLPDNARPPKQRFTLERVGPLPYPIADCDPTLAPLDSARVPGPKPRPPPRGVLGPPPHP